MTPAEQTAILKAWREYVHAVHHHHASPLRRKWQAVLAKEAAMEEALRAACTRQAGLFEERE